MLNLVTATTAEPVTLDEAKAHLRMAHSSDDQMIRSLITAAREVVERNTGRALAAATYLWALESCEQSPLSLPLFPVASVASVSYLDGNGVRRIIAPIDVTLDASRGTLAFLPREVLTGINVEFATASTAVPAPLKAAILLMVGDLYENAEANMVGTTVAENPTLQRLIFPYRLNWGV